ncbi:hypothetical protein ACVWWL_007097 [Bradyrhizobium sp. USDA 3696]
MTKTIMIDKTGGPEVLQYRDVDSAYQAKPKCESAKVLWD